MSCNTVTWIFRLCICKISFGPNMLLCGALCSTCGGAKTVLFTSVGGVVGRNGSAHSTMDWQCFCCCRGNALFHWNFWSFPKCLKFLEIFQISPYYPKLFFPLLWDHSSHRVTSELDSKSHSTLRINQFGVYRVRSMVNAAQTNTKSTLGFPNLKFS